MRAIARANAGAIVFTGLVVCAFIGIWVACGSGNSVTGALCGPCGALDKCNDGLTCTPDGTCIDPNNPNGCAPKPPMDLSFVPMDLSIVPGAPDLSQPLDLAGGGSCDGMCNPLPLTGHTSNVTGSLHAVSYVGPPYIAVGDSGALTTSSDGLTWTAGSFGATVGTNSFSGVATSTTATNKYVVVGGPTAGLGGAAFYSPDGTTWTQAAGAGAPTAAFDVVWTGTQFITAGSNGEFCTSPDGAAWTLHTATDAAFAGTYPTRVVWTGTKAVVVGGTANGSFVATSPDGVTWTAQAGIASATSQYLNGVAWGNSLLVAVGNGAAGAPADVVTSADGVTWTKQSSAGTALQTFHPATTLFTVGWTGTWWVSMGFQGVIIVSKDAISWQPGVPNGNVSMYAMTNAGPRGMVAVGASGVIVTAEK